MAFSKIISNKIHNYSEEQLKYILREIMSYADSDDSQDDFTEITKSDKFKEIGND